MHANPRHAVKFHDLLNFMTVTELASDAYNEPYQTNPLRAALKQPGGDYELQDCHYKISMSIIISILLHGQLRKPIEIK